MALRRRRIFTPTWSGEPETEELLGRAEDNVIPPPSPGIIRRVAPIVASVLGNSLPMMQEAAIQDAQERMNQQVGEGARQIAGGGGVLLSDSTNVVPIRRPANIPVNFDPSSGAIFERPVNSPQVDSQYEPMANLQAGYSGDDKVVPITRPRRMQPTFNPSEVSTSITPELAEQTVPFERPVYPENVSELTRERTVTPIDPATLERPRRIEPLDDSPMARLQREEYALRTTPVGMGRGKAALLGALQGLARGGLGGAAAGALVGVASPTSIARLKRQEQLSEVNQQMDDVLQREQRAAQIDWMRQRPEIQRVQMESRAANAQQAALMKQLSLQGKYKRGENRRLDAQLDAAGLSVSDFDKSRGQNPIFKSANGVQYQFNRQTGQFEEAQGIPQDQSGVRVPIRLSDGSVVNVRQDTAGMMDATRQAREQIRADRLEERDYQRGRDAKRDSEREQQRRQSAVSQLRTLRDLYRRAASAAAYGDERGGDDAAALIEMANGLAGDIEGAYGDIPEVREAIQKARAGEIRGGASVSK